MSPTRLEIAAVVVFALLCATLGYWLKASDAPRPENVAAAPAVRQKDGSLVAGRVPSVAPAKPPHQLPTGSKEERRIAVAVKPKQPNCDPVRVDLSLVRDGDGRRVVASSPDGLVLSALDMPILSGLVPPPARPWAAGASYNPITRRAGVWVERDLARLRLGAEVLQGEAGELTAMVRVGWRW